jgi:hypothetical protein
MFDEKSPLQNHFGRHKSHLSLGCRSNPYVLFARLSSDNSARSDSTRWWIRDSVERGTQPWPYSARAIRRTLPRPISQRNASDTAFDARPSVSKPCQASISTSSAMVAGPCRSGCIVRMYTQLDSPHTRTVHRHTVARGTTSLSCRE